MNALRHAAALAVVCLFASLMAWGGPAFAADNYTVKDSTGATLTICTDDIGSSVHATCNVLVDEAGVKITPAVSFAGTATVSINRPLDANAYAANDALSDSTSAPTSGGFTLSSVCRNSGKSGILTSVSVVSTNDPATTLQGEIWIFDSAPTALNDNAAFALSDADALKLVPGGVVPFALTSTTAGSGTNSYYSASGLGIAYTCSGSANLRFLVKVKTIYTPANPEVLTVRFAFVGTN